MTDGKNYVLLPEAKDYKRIGEGDKGLNTGGMGAVSPLPFFDDDLKEKISTGSLNLLSQDFKKINWIIKGLSFLD